MTKTKDNKPLNKRNKKEKLRTARGRKLSSKLWLERQINDPYVKAAKDHGYRSRAAYKLIEINEKFKLIKKGGYIIDLGAAPGGWTQVAIEKAWPKSIVIALDISDFEPIENAICLKGDFLDEATKNIVRSHLKDKADLVMSDMAAPSCGHTQTDHLKIIALCEEAFYFAKENLKEGGNFVAKILRGGTENKLLADLKKHFKVVKHFKPPSSRAESAEMYVIGLEFRQ